MWHNRCVTLLVLGWTAGGLSAQEANAPGPPPPSGGLEVRSVSAYAAYYSKTLPNGSGFQAGIAPLPADASFGGSAAFDWTHISERTTFFLNYTPSYTGRVRYSSLNSLNHVFSINTSRKLAPQWSLGFSAAGDLSTLEQSLFAPTVLSNVASVPSTFDDLSAAILSSKFTNNPQLGSVLTSAPLVESPVRNLLYGQRMFTSSAYVSLSYSYSPRFSITFSGGGGRAQRVSDASALPAANVFLIPDTTSGNASVAVSYSLSPLSQFGGTVSTSRVSSSTQDFYTTTSQAIYGRTFGRRWFMQIHGGVGVTNPVRMTSFALSTKPRPAAGGNLGIKTFSHTILGSYDRTVGDSYGLGASISSSASTTWRWRRPGRSWWVESSAGWQKLEGNALSNISGWHASAGFGQAVGQHLALLTQYAYLSYDSGQLPLPSVYNFSQSAVRVSLVWSPRPYTMQ